MESTKCYPGKLQRKRSNSGSLIKDMEGEVQEYTTQFHPIVMSRVTCVYRKMIKTEML